MRKGLIKNIIFNSGLIILTFLITSLVLSSAVFLYNGNINTALAVISIIVSVGVYFLVTYSQSKLEVILGGLIGAILFCVFIFCSQSIYDFEHDSNWYHKSALGCMANGWNPIYQEFGEFCETSDLNITDMHFSEVFTQHYCKVSWIVGANIYCLTNDIETGKAVNIFLVYILFVFVFHYLSTTRFKWWQAVIIGIVIIYNPLTVTQTFSLYVDGLLYSCLFGVITMLIGISDSQYKLPEVIKYFALFSLVVFCCNIKFTGLAYAGVFCILFYIIWNIYAIINKNFKQIFVKNTIFFFGTVVVAIFLVGFSTYVTNYMVHDHPLHPLAGENKRDIMTGNQPTAFNKINGVQRLLISVFSKTENIAGNKLPDLKFPFFVYEKEKETAALGADTRIAGFGPLFGGAICFSAAILAFGLYCLFKLNKYWFFIIISNVFLVLILLLCIQESWWARYSPYFYLLPVFALIFIFVAFNNESGFFKFIISGICAICVFLLIKNTNYFLPHVKTRIEETQATISNLEEIENDINGEPVKVFIADLSHYGIEFNLKDRGIEYIKVPRYSVISKKLYGSLMYVEDSKI